MQQLFTIAPFALIVLLVGGMLWLVRPDLLALLVWPAVLLYPKKLLHGALPLNAGVNDVFIVMLAIRMLVYQQPPDSPYYRWGVRVVLLAVGMAAMQILAEASGALFYPSGGLWLQTFRDLLKSVVFVSFALILVKSITSERQVRRHLEAFLVTLSVAFVLVWVCSLSPAVKQVFEDLGTESRAREFAYVQSTRPWGPFEFTTGLGIMIAATVPFALGLAATTGADTRIRALSAVTVVLAGLAEILTKSRSALTGIVFVLVVWLVASSRRWRLLPVLGVVALLIALYAMNSENASKLEARIDSDKLLADSALRTDLWKRMVNNPSPLVLAFGEGQFVIGIRLGLVPHNGYLGPLFVWGIGGVCMFFLLYFATVKWARLVKNLDSLPLGRGLAWGVLGSTLAMAVTALTSDPWFTSDYRFFVYFVLALIWQRKQSLEVLQAAPELSEEYGTLPDSYYAGAVSHRY